MPTMIQKYQCTTCEEIHDELVDADSCSFNHELGIGEQSPVPAVAVLDFWECDGNGCQAQYPDQFQAQECEASHEIGAEDGRQGTNGMIAELGDRLCDLGLTQAGHLFQKAGRAS